MPISIALLLCVPIGFLFYFEARWLIRHLFGRYEQRERRAARLFGALGASLIPLMYGFGLIEKALPGHLGHTIAFGFFFAGTWGIMAAIVAVLKGK